MSSSHTRHLQLARALPAWALAAIGAVVYLLTDPPSADLAAQEYRAWLFRDGGAELWDNGWYAGNPLPGYSVLFPPLGGTIGARVAGALAVVAASALFARLAGRHWGTRAYFASLWFAVVALLSIVSGRLTFTLGVAVGIAALLALHARRPLGAATLAALTSLASPVAALFLVLAAVAAGLADRGRRVTAAAVAVAAGVPAIVLNALFSGGGTEPFAASAFWPALAASALMAAALPARERALRIGAVLYALLCMAAFVVPNPLGGNATRLGALAAGPVLLGAMVGRRNTALVAALALPFAYWGLYPAVRDVSRADGDPSIQAGYHKALVRYLDGRTRREGSFRVEIPFTEIHWEANHVARSVPLARGWERQADRAHNALFYDGTLNPSSYRAWLDTYAVHYVALGDMRLDYSAHAEARMIEAGLPYLHEVWHDGHWRVFAVRDPSPLVEGVARRATITRDGFALRALHAGTALVRVRHTRWWVVTAGAACVQAGPDGMTMVRVKRPGIVRVRARLSGASCAG